MFGEGNHFNPEQLAQNVGETHEAVSLNSITMTEIISSLQEIRKNQSQLMDQEGNTIDLQKLISELGFGSNGNSVDISLIPTKIELNGVALNLRERVIVIMGPIRRSKIESALKGRLGELKKMGELDKTLQSEQALINKVINLVTTKDYGDWEMDTKLNSVDWQTNSRPNVNKVIDILKDANVTVEYDGQSLKLR